MMMAYHDSYHHHTYFEGDSFTDFRYSAVTPYTNW